MLIFFGGVIIASFIGGFLSSLRKAMREPVSDPFQASVETLFYNTPEENEARMKATRSHSFFRSLLSDVGLVLLILPWYWTCLYFQVF
jgi:hypothetical protein